MSIGSSDDSAKMREHTYNGKANAELFVEVYTKFVTAPSINCTDTVSSEIIKGIAEWVKSKTGKYLTICDTLAKAFFRYISKHVADIIEFEVKPNQFDISGVFNIPPTYQVVAARPDGSPKIREVGPLQISTLTVKFDTISQNKITINYLAVR